MPISDELFRRFIGAFLAAGVKLSEQRVSDAATEWVSLPDEEHQAAAEFAEAKARSTEARWMGWPANALKQRDWNAKGPGRLLPAPRAPTKAAAASEQATEAFLAHKNDPSKRGKYL